MSRSHRPAKSCTLYHHSKLAPIYHKKKPLNQRLDINRMEPEQGKQERRGKRVHTLYIRYLPSPYRTSAKREDTGQPKARLKGPKCPENPVAGISDYNSYRTGIFYCTYTPPGSPELEIYSLSSELVKILSVTFL